MEVIFSFSLQPCLPREKWQGEDSNELRTRAICAHQARYEPIHVVRVQHRVAVHVRPLNVAGRMLLRVAGWVEQGLYERRDIKAIYDPIAVRIPRRGDDAQPGAERRLIQA